MGTYPSSQQKSDREGCVLLATATGAKTSQCPILFYGRRKPALTQQSLGSSLNMDTGLEPADFKSAMGDRKAWGTIVILGTSLNLSK